MFDWLEKQAQIDELERQVLQVESRNRYLMQKLEELQQANSLKPSTDENPSSARTNASDYQQLLSVFQEKQQQYFQQVINNPEDCEWTERCLPFEL